MKNKQQTLEVLQRARRRLSAPERWIRKQEVRVAGKSDLRYVRCFNDLDEIADAPMCLIGAMKYEARRMHLSDEKVQKILIDVAHQGDRRSIWMFNDSHEHDEVLEWLDIRIKERL